MNENVWQKEFYYHDIWKNSAKCFSFFTNFTHFHHTSQILPCETDIFSSSFLECIKKSLFRANSYYIINKFVFKLILWQKGARKCPLYYRGRAVSAIASSPLVPTKERKRAHFGASAKVNKIFKKKKKMLATKKAKIRKKYSIGVDYFWEWAPSRKRPAVLFVPDTMPLFTDRAATIFAWITRYSYFHHRHHLLNRYTSIIAGHYSARICSRGSQQLTLFIYFSLKCIDVLHF